MQEGLATALLPLRRYADFRGRSTRFETVLFLVLVALLMRGAGEAAAFYSEEAAAWTCRVLLLLLACPLLALMARRLHDTGRSAWWLLVGLPLLAAVLWEAYAGYADPTAPSPIDDLPVGVRLALAMSGVLLFALLAWDDEEADNRFGANPRYGEMAAA